MACAGLLLAYLSEDDTYVEIIFKKETKILWKISFLCSSRAGGNLVDGIPPDLSFPGVPMPIDDFRFQSEICRIFRDGDY